MRVGITGGLGRIGRVLQKELADHGHEACLIDFVIRPEDLALEAETTVLRADLMDFALTMGALEGCEAVVHLAAIPNIRYDSNRTVFLRNIQMFYNVLDASRLLGIKKVAAASSECALGYIFARRPIPVKYYPIDEEHPIDPHDGYGLSKAVGEDLCRSFSSAFGMEATSLRFGRVVFSEDQYAERASESQADADLFARFFWSYVDVRDVATACRLALEADGLGGEVFNIIASDTLQKEPTRDLMRRFHPEADDRSNGGEGTFSPHDSGKAARMLGWTPEHSWTMYVD